MLTHKNTIKYLLWINTTWYPLLVRASSSTSSFEQVRLTSEQVRLTKIFLFSWSYFKHYSSLLLNCQVVPINLPLISLQYSWVVFLRMQYTEAMMNELMRIRCLNYFGLQHMASADTQLGGYNIPKVRFRLIYWIAILTRIRILFILDSGIVELNEHIYLCREPLWTQASFPSNLITATGIDHLSLCLNDGWVRMASLAWRRKDSYPSVWVSLSNTIY